MRGRLGPRGTSTAAREEYDELPSTQDRALALARAGAPPGTRVVARRQTAGRGRLDHVWASPPGGLYLSVVLPPPVAPTSLLPLAVGAALADELTRRWGVRPRIKWPNDLLVEGPASSARKLSGILVDRLAAPHPALVAGIGVNVAPVSADALVGPIPPVALADVVSPCPPLPEVEEAAASAALAAAEGLGAPVGTAELLARCRALLYGVGRSATVDGVPAGRIAALADDGALLLDRAGARRAVRAGDVRVEGP